MAPLTVAAAALFTAAPLPAGEAPTAKVDTDNFSLEASDVSVKAGKEGKLLVQIKAKKGHHVNEQYNHKVKVAGPEGLELPKPELKKADGTMKDANTFEFAVPIKALRAGKYTVNATVKFSVCSNSQCLIEKREVAATVSAK